MSLVILFVPLRGVDAAIDDRGDYVNVFMSDILYYKVCLKVDALVCIM